MVYLLPTVSEALAKYAVIDCGHSPMKHVSVFPILARRLLIFQQTCFWNNEILTPIQKNGMVGPGLVAFKKLKILLDGMMLRRTKVKLYNTTVRIPLTFLLGGTSG